MEHYFDEEIAVKYGLESAVVYEYIKIRCARNKHIINGRSWTRISLEKFKNVFPYFSEYTIARAIDTLNDNFVIEIDNFNNSPMDRTRWYSICGA